MSLNPMQTFLTFKALKVYMKPKKNESTQGSLSVQHEMFINSTFLNLPHTTQQRIFVKAFLKITFPFSSYASIFRFLFPSLEKKMKKKLYALNGMSHVLTTRKIKGSHSAHYQVCFSLAAKLFLAAALFQCHAC